MAKLYVAVFTINGVYHTMNGYSENKEICRQHVGWMLDRRNANPDDIPEMDDEIAELKELYFGVSTEQAADIVARVKSGQLPGESAQEMFPGAEGMLLHRPLPPTQD